MDYDAGAYRKLVVKQYPARSLRETAEGKYWKRFAAPSVAKQVRGAASKPSRQPRAGAGVRRPPRPGRRAPPPPPAAAAGAADRRPPTAPSAPRRRRDRRSAA
jgi:hypothetical protein